MNINGLLNKIGFKIKEESKSYAISENELLEKSINKIKASFLLLSEEAKRIDAGHNLIKKQKMKSDLKSLLKIIDSKSGNDEKIVMLTLDNVKKLMVKYNIKDAAVQYNSEYYNGLEDRIATAKKAALEKRNKNGVECDEPVNLLDTAEIKKFAMAREEAEINKKTAARVKEILEVKQRLSINAKEAIGGQNQEVEKPEVQVNEKTDFQGQGQEELREKGDISTTAKDSKENSKVIKDGKKLPWYASIPVVGAIAIAAISGVTTLLGNTSEQVKKHPSDNTGYTDSNEPRTAVNKSTTEAQSSDYIAYTTAVTGISSCSTTMQTEKSTTKKSKEPKTTTTDNTKESTETQTTTTDNTKESTATTTQNKDFETEPVVFDIGDKVNVSDGLLYSETCLGKGEKNKIGNVSWRPATEYYVDRIAFCHGNEVLGVMNKGEKDVRQVLEDYASQYKIDVSEIDTSVLLSLTPGSGDTGWASISIEELEQNVSKDEGAAKDAEQTNTKKTTKSDRDR